MAATEEALELLPRLRQADPAAQAQFCAQFEQYIRREVRVRLRLDQRLCRVLDSVDVCQDVLNSFLVRTAAGQYELEALPQLLALLKRILKNKLSKKRRWYYAERRSLGRTESEDSRCIADAASPAPSVSQALANRELLDSILSVLDDGERALAQLRAEGKSWPEIACVVGGTPDALRMKLARAVERAILTSAGPE